MRELLFFSLSIFSLSVFGQNPKKVVKKLGNDPIFYVDSIKVEKSEVTKFNPEQIALIKVYKDSSAIKLIGPDGKDGVIYIQTIDFSKDRYWRYFREKSIDYSNIVLTPKSDSVVQYILNGRILKKNFEGELSLINDEIFIDIKVIDKDTLQKDYGVMDKMYGVVIKSDKPDDLYKAKKKF